MFGRVSLLSRQPATAGPRGPANAGVPAPRGTRGARPRQGRCLAATCRAPAYKTRRMLGPSRCKGKTFGPVEDFGPLIHPPRLQASPPRGAGARGHWRLRAAPGGPASHVVPWWDPCQRFRGAAAVGRAAGPPLQGAQTAREPTGLSSPARKAGSGGAGVASRRAAETKDLPKSPGLRVRALPRGGCPTPSLIRNCRPRIGLSVQTWAGVAGAAIQGKMMPAASLWHVSGFWTR